MVHSGLGSTPFHFNRGLPKYKEKPQYMTPCFSSSFKIPTEMSLLVTLAKDFIVPLSLNREEKLEKCLSFTYPFQLQQIAQAWMTQTSIRLNIFDLLCFLFLYVLHLKNKKEKQNQSENPIHFWVWWRKDLIIKWNYNQNYLNFHGSQNKKY